MKGAAFSEEHDWQREINAELTFGFLLLLLLERIWGITSFVSIAALITSFLDLIHPLWMLPIRCRQSLMSVDSMPMGSVLASCRSI